MDLLKNRFCGDGYCLCSGDFLCKKNHEVKAGFKSITGWHPYDASGIASHSGRLLSVIDLQSQTSFRKFSYGNF